MLRHPYTGEPCLYADPGYTTSIVGLPKAESDALLEMLFRHIEIPAFSCRFKWRPDSVAFWDNRAAQHQALWDYHPQRRFGYRVTVCGDAPFYRN